ncbi:hypothetical protein Droror1_Dr00024970 [Drosera rotundifolia]
MILFAYSPLFFTGGLNLCSAEPSSVFPLSKNYVYSPQFFTQQSRGGSSQFLCNLCDWLVYHACGDDPEVPPGGGPGFSDLFVTSKNAGDAQGKAAPMRPAEEDGRRRDLQGKNRGKSDELGPGKFLKVTSWSSPTVQNILAFDDRSAVVVTSSDLQGYEPSHDTITIEAHIWSDLGVIYSRIKDCGFVLGRRIDADGSNEVSGNFVVFRV